jgi:CubicO group peptidase (beta-lactamase class C family)
MPWSAATRSALMCPPYRDTGADAGSRIDALMRAYQGTVPGAGVAVLHHGAPIVRRAYGLADVENGIAAARPLPR